MKANQTWPSLRPLAFVYRLFFEFPLPNQLPQEPALFEPEKMKQTDTPAVEEPLPAPYFRCLPQGHALFQGAQAPEAAP
ncbi:hypothetical protein ACD591_16425 [Rufibacter glacialis]|uniref:Uncharacterized protein n=1 Tax=Rufibacter glacialis TaxID=1259555 RepID=A0A5M8QSK7_9BACT|nr:hypothetical protein [Rufibacter glacialis]KAA6437473.1 hypothetical protein FOE74_02935 [Rufibacter glacialis]GGK59064.1 hypothetical protein GCM10011405_03890 [Rufibacter glacialis]